MTLGYEKFINEDVNIKLIILYTLKMLGICASNTVLTNILTSDLSIEYFLLQQNLYELVKDNYLRIFKEEKVEKHELTFEGAKMIEFFEQKIPFTIREKINFGVKKYKKTIGGKTEVVTGVEITDFDEFVSTLKITENNALLFEIKVNAGSNELAERTANYMKENAEELYLKITEQIMKKI